MFTDKIDGGITTIPFSGTVSQYGFYQDGYDYATKYGVKFVLMSADEIAFARLRNWNERHPAPAPAPLDPTVIEAAVKQTIASHEDDIVAAARQAIADSGRGTAAVRLAHEDAVEKALRTEI